MDKRSFFRSYTRSPLGIGSILAAVVAGAAVLILGLPLPLSVLVAIGAFAVLLVLGLALGAGQMAAVTETDREAGG